MRLVAITCQKLAEVKLLEAQSRLALLGVLATANDALPLAKVKDRKFSWLLMERSA